MHCCMNIDLFIENRKKNQNVAFFARFKIILSCEQNAAAKQALYSPVNRVAYLFLCTIFTDRCFFCSCIMFRFFFIQQIFYLFITFSFAVKIFIFHALIWTGSIKFCFHLKANWLIVWTYSYCSLLVLLLNTDTDNF